MHAHTHTYIQTYIRTCIHTCIVQVAISTEDDRKGEAVKGRLTELGFCRDAPTLALACCVVSSPAPTPLAPGPPLRQHRLVCCL